jgi:hypothetical protein
LILLCVTTSLCRSPGDFADSSPDCVVREPALFADQLAGFAGPVRYHAAGDPPPAGATTRSRERARETLRAVRRVLPASEAAQAATPPGVQVILYRNAAQYARCAGTNPSAVPSQSRYDSRRRALHIPVDAPATTWRHEWVHVLLADRRPAPPYWLHEGLAILLEESARLDGRSRLPERVVARRPAVIAAVADGGLRRLLNRDSPDGAAAALAAWFCAYLDRQDLLGAALAGDTEPAALFPARLQAEFFDWLGSSDQVR